ncbi:DNA-binding protein [Pseudomonas agarici]|uniref:DNA-binding protein n=1 Tax=Pseudomonas agarici TaxID=46677 RepID=A0A0X1T1T8_PSEAA|nr:Arc family DNA-binding protein [Pseudomonas agarici]AMB86050.1 DNA-binding protein [Pseudomonas agarici]
MTIQQRQLEEKFVVRLPDGMRSRIAENARANVRSMNSEIIHRLERVTELESALERAHKIIDQLLVGSTSSTKQTGAQA